MPIDRRTVNAFFERKVPGAQRVEGARHVSYRVVSGRHVALLPVLTITRGPAGEDLPLRNVKGLAEDLGMTLEGFIEGTKCRVRAEYVTYCAACRIVCHAQVMYELDSIAYNEDMVTALHSSLQQWIGVILHDAVMRPSDREQKESLRAIRRVEDGRKFAVFDGIMAWIKAVGSGPLGLPV